MDCRTADWTKMDTPSGSAELKPLRRTTICRGAPGRHARPHEVQRQDNATPGPIYSAQWHAPAVLGSLVRPEQSLGSETDRAADILLTKGEIRTLTGCAHAQAQLDELRRQGFHRARRNRLGQVVLERAHYEAVCRGDVINSSDASRPQLRSVRRANEGSGAPPTRLR